MKEKIICPNCGQECFIGLDEWGRTPFHLHCSKCKINIGSTNIKKAIQLLKNYHEKETYLEYYDGNIQLLQKGGQFIINNE